MKNAKKVKPERDRSRPLSPIDICYCGAPLASKFAAKRHREICRYA